MTSKNVAAIVGVKEDGDKRLFKSILCSITDKGNGALDWAFKCRIMPEEELVNIVKRCDGTINIKLDNTGTKIVTNGPSFGRFKNGAMYVILSEIEANGRIVGYKVATSSGNVNSIKAKSLYSYCGVLTADNKVPIQNAIFVPATADKSAFIRAYDGLPFIREVIPTNKNKFAKSAPEPNDKQNVPMDNKSKLQKIFTAEQIKELQAGKKAGVNIKVYANPKLTPEQMSILRQTLEDGNDPSPFASPDFKVEAMDVYRIDLKYGGDVVNYVNPKYEPERIQMLSEAYFDGISLDEIGDPSIPLEELNEVINRLEAGIYKEYKVSK